MAPSLSSGRAASSPAPETLRASERAPVERWAPWPRASAAMKGPLRWPPSSRRGRNTSPAPVQRQTQGMHRNGRGVYHSFSAVRPFLASKFRYILSASVDSETIHSYFFLRIFSPFLVNNVSSLPSCSSCFAGQGDGLESPGCVDGQLQSWLRMAPNPAAPE